MDHLTKKIKFYVSFALFASLFISGCAVPEPRPVPVEDLTEIQPKKIMKREAFIKPPKPTPFAEKMEPVTKDLMERTRLYTLIFESAPLGGDIKRHHYRCGL